MVYKYTLMYMNPMNEMNKHFVCQLHGLEHLNLISIQIVCENFIMNQMCDVCVLACVCVFEQF